MSKTVISLYDESMSKQFTVIFDFDGTLANTLELVAKIYNDHAQDFGALQIDMAEMSEYRKLGYKKSMKKTAYPLDGTSSTCVVCEQRDEATYG